MLRLKIVAMATLIATSSAFAHFKDSVFDLPRNILAEVQLNNYKIGMFQLRQLDLDIAGVDLESNTADVVINEQEYQQLLDIGLNVTIKMTKTLMRGPDANYKTSEEVETLLKEFHAKYPDISELKIVGKSLEGRNIWALKISDNPSMDESEEPVVLFNGMHHAREVMTPEVNLDIIEYLLTNYGTDQKVTHWVDSNVIWVMPMFNVDGNNIVWTKNSMWRKNTRNGHGVDLNRNYPYAWGTCNGSSGSTSSDTYRGPSPASEPETNVMMNLVKEIRPVFDISYHSYSKLVIYPFGCKGKKVANVDVVEGIGKDIGKLLGYTPGTSWETLYATDGGDIDWMYGEYQVIPYVIEVNSSSEGFQPSYSVRKPTVELNRKGWMHLLNRLDGAGIRGQVTDLDGKAVKVFSVKIDKWDGANFVNYMTYKGKEDGTYHAVVNAGTYRVTVSAPQVASWAGEVVVKDTRVTQNIELGSR